ncbi:MAG: hypothetical protein ABW360_07795 [Phenylobacterium sp.]
MTTARVAGRLSVAFLLDFVDVGRGDRDPVDMLILLAIVQANVAPVMRETELQRAYAAYDTPPPDDARRPVSVSAVAGSLGMPYETVRRRVVRMVRSGWCVVGPTGVYVSQTVLTSPEHMAGAFASYERLRMFYYELKDLGVLPDYPPAAEPVEASAMIRAIMRLFGDYFLRTVKAVTESIGDVGGGLVMLGIFRANTEHLSNTGNPADGPDEIIDDALRVPVSATHLAERLRLPKETVRRHVMRLVAEGRCVRTERGLLVPTEVLILATQSVSQHLTHLNRLFVGLAQLGVLAAWDKARAPA